MNRKKQEFVFSMNRMELELDAVETQVDCVREFFGIEYKMGSKIIQPTICWEGTLRETEMRVSKNNATLRRINAKLRAVRAFFGMDWMFKNWERKTVIEHIDVAGVDSSNTFLDGKGDSDFQNPNFQRLENKSGYPPVMTQDEAEAVSDHFYNKHRK